MQDKKVRISVEDSKLKDLGRTATTLANDMIKSSRDYSTSSKEVLKDLEEQIKLIEKRNRLDSESRQTGLQTRFSAGEITRPQLQTGLQNIRGENREDKLQVTLLREVIDAIKQTSKNEIREDRIGVEKNLRGDKSINRLGVTGDPQEALKRTIQQAMLGDLGEEESEQKGKFRAFGKFGDKAGRTFNTAAGIGTSKNALYAGAAILGLTPVIGQGLSQVANRFLSAGETAESSMSNWGFANLGKKEGFDTEWNRIKGDNYSTLGMSPSDVLNKKAELRRSIGSGLGGDLGEIIGAEKFVGQGSISQLAGVSRYGQGDITKVLRVLEAGNKSTTRLTEDISTYVQASNQALNISSSVDEAKLSRTIVGVSEATGMEGRNLGQVTGAIQGLGQSSNPIVKSMMMRSFRQSNPNASLFDIQAMMEDPLSNIDKGGGKFFENMKSMSGGGDMYKQVLYSIFGGKLSRTKIGEILDGGGDFTEIAKESQLVEESSIKFKSEAKTKIGIGATATATADAEFQKIGRESLKVAAQSVQELKNLLDQGKEMYSALTGLNESIDTASDKVIKAMEGDGLMSTITTGIVTALSTNKITGGWVTQELVDALTRANEEK